MKTAIFVLSVAVYVLAQDCGISPNIPHWKRILENDKDGITSKVLGGTFSVKGSWPWLVHTNTRCTGSIVHPNWVITAKHCIDKNMTIGYGDPNINKQVLHHVDQTFVVNPDCEKRCIIFEDIALLYVEKPIPDNSRDQFV
uniref:Peptidase S1 domain-containing protein n=1 Tax=Panagrolaimus sp. JU765 TaxID=591449 RepID=A0AC34Q1L0_9BILA